MEILLTSTLAFVSTNIDDLFLLILFYGDRKFKGGEILAGQLLGISSLLMFRRSILPVDTVDELVDAIIAENWIELLSDDKKRFKELMEEHLSGAGS